MWCRKPALMSTDKQARERIIALRSSFYHIHQNMLLHTFRSNVV